MGIGTLVTTLRVLNTLSDDRCTYEHMRETTHYEGLAAQLVIRDQIEMGDAATVPDPIMVERMEEELQRLFSAAHILSRVYTSLDD